MELQRGTGQRWAMAMRIVAHPCLAKAKLGAEVHRSGEVQQVKAKLGLAMVWTRDAYQSQGIADQNEASPGDGVVQ